MAIEIVDLPIENCDLLVSLPELTENFMSTAQESNPGRRLSVALTDPTASRLSFEKRALFSGLPYH